jgi:uncharacterized membrane protein
MDFDFLKNLIDFIKAIQVIEYAYNKIKQGSKWVIENWNSVEKKIYSKTFNIALILFLLIGFGSLLLLSLCNFTITLLTVKVTINTFWLATGKFIFLTYLGGTYFLYFYEEYNRDRKVYLER